HTRFSRDWSSDVCSSDLGALLDFDYREVRVSQTIIANSRQVFLVADHSKFGRNAMVRLGSLKDLDAFVTDAPPPPAIAQLLAANGVRLDRKSVVRERG